MDDKHRTITLNDLPELRSQLRRMALGLLRKGDSVAPSDLIQLALMKQKGSRSWAEITWADRGEVFNHFRYTMKQVLTERGLARRSEKRGAFGYGARVALEDLEIGDLAQAVRTAQSDVEQVVALGVALERLAERHPRWRIAFDSWYFFGLDSEESVKLVEELKGLSPRTVLRERERAREWLEEQIVGVINDEDDGKTGGR